VKKRKRFEKGIIQGRRLRGRGASKKVKAYFFRRGERAKDLYPKKRREKEGNSEEQRRGKRVGAAPEKKTREGKKGHTNPKGEPRKGEKQ